MSKQKVHYQVFKHILESDKEQKSKCILNHFAKDFKLVLDIASKYISLSELLTHKLQLVNNVMTLKQLENDFQKAQNELSKFIKHFNSNTTLLPTPSSPIRSPKPSAKKSCSRQNPPVIPRKNQKLQSVNGEITKNQLENEAGK